MLRLPLRLREDSLSLEVDGRGKTRLRHGRVEAVAAAAVRGLSAKSVLLVDLALNWNDAAGRPLQVVRLRSDRFDPRRLVAYIHSRRRASCRGRTARCGARCC